MSEQTNYPKRGQMSEDGVFFTDNKGVVYARREIGHYSCSGCDIDKSEFNQVACILCGNDIWRLYIDTPIVPSSEEVAACEMARAQIEFCSTDIDCERCGHFETRLCPVRKYLFAHGDTQAWEVK